MDGWMNENNKNKQTKTKTKKIDVCMDAWMYG